MQWFPRLEIQEFWNKEKIYETLQDCSTISRLNSDVLSITLLVDLTCGDVPNRAALCL